jgi:hypothetical protein
MHADGHGYTRILSVFIGVHLWFASYWDGGLHYTSTLLVSARADAIMKKSVGMKSARADLSARVLPFVN